MIQTNAFLSLTWACFGCCAGHRERESTRPSKPPGNRSGSSGASTVPAGSSSARRRGASRPNRPRRPPHRSGLRVHGRAVGPCLESNANGPNEPPIRQRRPSVQGADHPVAQIPLLGQAGQAAFPLVAVSPALLELRLPWVERLQISGGGEDPIARGGQDRHPQFRVVARDSNMSYM